MSDVPRRVVLITGAARGLGLQMAKEFLQSNYRVVLSDRDATPLAESVSALALDFGETRVSGVVADVGDDQSVRAMVEFVEQWSGRLDVLVTNAGMITRGATEELDLAAWQATIDVNVTGTVRCAKAAFALLRESSGTVITIGSIGSTLGMPLRAAYVTSKTAVVGLTRALAAEWGPHGIRVNAIAPGFIETAMMRSGFDDGLLNEETMTGRIPLRRLGSPSEISGVAVFLAAPQASYINGACIPVDGGVTIDGTFF